MGVFGNLRSVIRFRPVEWSAAKRRLRKAADVSDLRRIARRRLPRGVFDYLDGAAEDEVTYRWNTSSFRHYQFRPRVLRDVSQVDTTAPILGRARPIPLILSPTGFTRILDSQGELAVARAADRLGIPYTLSSLSTRSIEEVREASAGDLWFQVYVWKDKGLLSEMLERAAAADYSTIVITVDTAVLGRRERDVRRGFTLPPKVGPGTIVDGLLHPGWTLDFVRSPAIRFANIAGKSVGDGSDPISLSEFISAQFDPSLSWDDIKWFRERWNRNLVIKGIQAVEDAVLAAKEGADAVALSNHGGRQLDGAPPPIELVAPVREQVGDAIEVYCDGGIRRGSDILKAVALGADAGMAGRAYLYGLGAAGEEGVDHALTLLKSGLERSMALIGCQSMADVDSRYVVLRTRTTGGSQ
jgi:L-lactate dehydrogenase (cytochrome)